MAKFSLLLPPSTLQTRDGLRFAPDVFDYRESTTFNFFHLLIGERRTLIDAVHRAIEVDGEEVMAEVLGGNEALQAMKNVYLAELIAARRRYAAGEFYGAVDFQALPTGAQRRFLENGVIISGLFGVLRPDDLIPPYGLPIDAHVPGFGSVADYWRPLITPLINDAIKGKFVWDVLPDTHHRAWEDHQTYHSKARIRFVDRAGQEPEDVIRLQGKLLHHLVQQNSIGIPAVVSWGDKDAQGFRFDEERSILEDQQDMTYMLSRQ